MYSSLIPRPSTPGSSFTELKNWRRGRPGNEALCTPHLISMLLIPFQCGEKGHYANMVRQEVVICYE